MTTYAWIIAGLSCAPVKDGKNNVVETIHWRRQVVDNDFVADIFGDQEIPFSSVDPFTEYTDLTNNQVIQWLEITMSQDTINAIDLALQNQLNEVKNPAQVTLPLPWQT